jgi:hypothetical protein
VSYTQQQYPPLAGLALAGLVSTGAQSFAGLKTFKDAIAIGSQNGGVAIGFQSEYDALQWPNVGYGTPEIRGWHMFGGPLIYSPQSSFRADNPNGFVMGGINSGLTSAGLAASAQSYLADVWQTQDIQLALLSGRTGANVVVKIGTNVAAPNANAEILRVGYNMAASLSSDGTPLFRVYGDGRAALVGSLDSGGFTSPGFSVASGNMSCAQITNGGLIVGAASQVQELMSQAPNTNGQPQVKIGSFSAVTAAGAKLVSFMNGRSGTEVGSIDKDGNVRFAGNLGVGNAAAASVGVGTLVKKVQIFDASGTSLGFIPVYSTIT